jgi:hypothetical protein
MPARVEGISMPSSYTMHVVDMSKKVCRTMWVDGETEMGAGRVTVKVASQD